MESTHVKFLEKFQEHRALGKVKYKKYVFENFKWQMLANSSFSLSQ